MIASSWSAVLAVDRKRVLRYVIAADGVHYDAAIPQGRAMRRDLRVRVVTECCAVKLDCPIIWNNSMILLPIIIILLLFHFPLGESP
jgi:hypothetical protein